MTFDTEAGAASGRELVTPMLLGQALAAGDAAAFVYDDQELRYVAVNLAAAILTGRPPDELLTMRVPDLVVAPSERLQQAARDVTAGSVDLGQALMRPKRGDPLKVQFVSERTSLGSLETFVLTLCWPARNARIARREAGELREEAQALRAQAAQQVQRSRRARGAAAAARPRLIFFYSETSGASRRVEGYLAQVLQRRRNHDTFEIVRVCAERRPELVERFHVEQIPTLLVVGDGRVQARLDAPRGRRPLQQALAPWLR